MRTLREYLKSFRNLNFWKRGADVRVGLPSSRWLCRYRYRLRRANAAKAAMQAAVDSTALALSKNVESMNAEQSNTRASEYFKSIFSRPDVKSIVIKGVYSKTSGSKIVVNGSGAVDDVHRDAGL